MLFFYQGIDDVIVNVPDDWYPASLYLVQIYGMRPSVLGATMPAEKLSQTSRKMLKSGVMIEAVKISLETL